jgi:Inositol-pentakisphosphate 2-kinase
LNFFLIIFTAARKTKIIGSRYGLLCRDVAFLPRDALLQSRGNFRKTSPTFCIEIKTKQGFILDEIIDPNIDGIQKCRFCYLQVRFRGNFKVVNCKINIYFIFTVFKIERKQD